MDRDYCCADQCHFYNKERREGSRKSEVTMKFLLVVVIIRLVVSWLMGEKATCNIDRVESMDSDIRHPAEFELR
jgi:predicted nucleic acid-binding Zn ribbon protein